MEGTFEVWDLLVNEDINAGAFEMKDFIKATKEGVRMPMYNRIDYSDIYAHAKEIHKKRTLKERDSAKAKERIALNKLEKCSFPSGS